MPMGQQTEGTGTEAGEAAEATEVWAREQGAGPPVAEVPVIQAGGTEGASGGMVGEAPEEAQQVGIAEVIMVEEGRTVEEA
jgi:hypothetical protein